MQGSLRDGRRCLGGSPVRETGRRLVARCRPGMSPLTGLPIFRPDGHGRLRSMPASPDPGQGASAFTVRLKDSVAPIEPSEIRVTLCKATIVGRHSASRRLTKRRLAACPRSSRDVANHRLLSHPAASSASADALTTAQWQAGRGARSDPRGRHLFQRALAGHAGRAEFVRLCGAATRSSIHRAYLYRHAGCRAALRWRREPFRSRARSCGLTRSRYCSILTGAPSAHEAYTCRLASRCVQTGVSPELHGTYGSMSEKILSPGRRQCVGSPAAKFSLEGERAVRERELSSFGLTDREEHEA